VAINPDSGRAYSPHGFIESEPHYGNSLSVSDVERLAKAGVAIKFDDIRHQITRDETPCAPPPELTNTRHFVNPLSDAIMDRWERRERALRPNDIRTTYPSFHIYASIYENTVSVYVALLNAPPVII
jgi:hypothetical protein